MIKIKNNVEKLYEDQNDILDLNRMVNLKLGSVISNIENNLKNINIDTDVIVFINRNENNNLKFEIDSTDSTIIKLIQDVISKSH